MPSSSSTPLLYELGLHGSGWRYEQTPNEAAADGWGSGREVELPQNAAEAEAANDGEAAEAIGSTRELVLAAVSAARRLDAPALRQLWLRPHPLLTPSMWLRDTVLACGAGGECYAPQRLLAELPEWKLALCASTEMLAIWRHDDLFLLSPRDNYAQPVALWRSPVDPAPHRRCLAWNADDTLLAACGSDGVVHVLDARCRPLHTLPPHEWLAADADGARAAAAAHAAAVAAADFDAAAAAEAARSDAPSVVGLAWREPAGARGISSELLLLCADRMLRRIAVPSAATAAVHRTRAAPADAGALPLGSQHALVTAMAFDQASGLLAIGGGGSALSAHARLLLAKLPPEDERAHRPLTQLSLWALTDGD